MRTHKRCGYIYTFNFVLFQRSHFVGEMNFILKNRSRGFEKRFAETILRLKAYGPTFMVMAAVLTGVIAGLAIVGFRWLIVLSNDYVFLDIGDSFPLAAFIANRYAVEAKGHGVPEVMSAMARKAGIMRPRVALVKTVVSAICI